MRITEAAAQVPKGPEAEEAVAMRFADNLARCRQQAGLSQHELATRAGLHRTAIGMLESGKRVPRVDTLVKLMRALAVSPEALLEGL